VTSCYHSSRRHSHIALDHYVLHEKLEVDKPVVRTNSSQVVLSTASSLQHRARHAHHPTCNISWSVDCTQHQVHEDHNINIFVTVSVSLPLRGNCLLKQVIEGRIKGGMDVTRRRGRRRRKLLDGLKKRRGYSHLKVVALDRTMWRNRFGGGFGPVVRLNSEWMKLSGLTLKQKAILKAKEIHLYISPRTSGFNSKEGGSSGYNAFWLVLGSSRVRILAPKSSTQRCLVTHLENLKASIWAVPRI